MTIEAVSTGDPGWEDFLLAYNEFCSRHNGIPLFNQTDLVTPEQVKRALGDRLQKYEAFRRRFDPQNRLLNPYFRELLDQEK